MSAREALARAVLDRALDQRLKIATAESCTGGLIAAELTGIAGSSHVFERGWVTYSNEAKHELLGVAAETLQAAGAVSGDTAAEMAVGALARSRAQLAVSVTGIAGPGGGSDEKPVGLVWFGLARDGQPTQTLEQRFGDLGRSEVRARSVETALELLRDAMT